SPERLQEPFQTKIFLGDQDFLGTGTDSRVKRNMTGIAPHHLHKKKPVMRTRRIADFVNYLNNRIDSGVVTKCVTGAKYIVVYGARNPDDGKIKLGAKNFGTGETAIAANHYQRIDSC